MKITNLKFTKRGDRVNLYIDEKYTLSLEKSLIVDFGVYIGQEVTKKEIKEWKTLDMGERLFRKVLNLIVRRPRSKKEIYLYLKRKLFKVKSKDKVIRRVTSKLERRGYIDDHKFALWWIKNRMLYKPRGKYLILLELRQKGINRDIISGALEDAGLDSGKEMKYALDLGRKRKRTLSNLMDERDKKRFFNYLSRKGFGYSTIKKVYKKLIK